MTTIGPRIDYLYCLTLPDLTLLFNFVLSAKAIQLVQNRSGKEPSTLNDIILPSTARNRNRIHLQATMPFSSPHPPVSLPPNESIWSFFFNSSHSPLSTPSPSNTPSGYLDASTGSSLSYPDVKKKATALSTSLTLHHGFNAGDTCILFSQNSIWYPVAMFAVLRVGGVVSGASPAYGVEEMSYALRTSGAKFLMTHPERLGVAVKACEAVGLSKECIFLLEGRKEGFKSVEDLILEGEGNEVEEWMGVRDKGNRDVCAFLSFSSGTTGLPKAVSKHFYLSYTAEEKLMRYRS
jgi:4-coumarate--CoA ligase